MIKMRKQLMLHSWIVPS